jgi:uncharacterized protein (DUF2236 family)
VIPVDHVRSWLGGVVRSRVAGPRREELISELKSATATEPGWVTKGSPAWIVHSDVATFVGGLRALLLQSLHPLAMAGVAQHSDYRHDPWGRLQRTAAFLARTTFGSATQAVEACATVRKVHERVTGTAPDGRPYTANDPHLLAWVHLCEVDSFLKAHQRYGRPRLDAARADAYVAEMARVGRELGVLAPPTDVASLAEALDAYRPELTGTREAIEAARFLLITPPLPLPARPFYALLAAAAVETLPGWAREMLRLPVRPPLIGALEPALVRPAGEFLVRSLRWALTSPFRSPA